MCLCQNEDSGRVPIKWPGIVVYAMEDEFGQALPTPRVVVSVLGHPFVFPIFLDQKLQPELTDTTLLVRRLEHEDGMDRDDRIVAINLLRGTFRFVLVDLLEPKRACPSIEVGGPP